MLFAQAQGQEKVVNLRPPRPKVGVALGGGGAKGAAHIGVLKYLEEMEIPIDYVAGTSMGSIIGGLYAMGYSPDELAVLIGNMNWSEYVGNRISRSALSPEVRQRNSTLSIVIPFSLDALINKRGRKSTVSFMPSAYVNNTALINLFNDLCIGYQNDMDFNDLPIPFACVATDIKTGKEIDIREGSVPTAMRASMAIPGVFSPVVMNGHLLVDGGLVNNFPADLLKEMGADIIIGVEVSDADTSLMNDESVTLPDILNGLINNAVNSKRHENQMLCDIHLTPDLTGYGTLSFSHDAIDTLIQRGYNEAAKHHSSLTQIKRGLDSINGAPVSKHLRAPKAKSLGNAPIIINKFIVNTSNPSQNKWLISKGGLKIGKPILKKNINRAIDIYRGTGAFDDITYNISQNGHDTLNGKIYDTYELVMNFKPTQPHVLGLGFRYDTEEGAAMLINLNLNGKKFGGSKLNLKGKLSYNPKFNITYSYSLASLINFNLSYNYREQHFIMGSSDLSYHQHKFSGFISQFHLLNANTAIGLSYSSTAFGYLPDFNSLNSTTVLANQFLTPFINIEFDNLDDRYFPRRGIYMRMGGHYYYEPKAVTDKESGDLCFAFLSNITPSNGRITISPKAYGRFTFNPSQHFNLWSHCGGEVAGRHFEEQMPFVGIQHLKAIKGNVVIIRCDVRYNLYRNHYFTAIYNYMFSQDEQFNGIGLRYAYDSFLGPIALTAQWSDCTKEFSTYASIGYTF